MDKAKTGGGVVLLAVALAASIVLLTVSLACAGVRAVSAPSPAASTSSVQETVNREIITGSYEKVIKDTVSVDDNAAAYHFRRTYEYKVTDEYPVAVEGEDGGNA